MRRHLSKVLWLLGSLVLLFLLMAGYARFSQSQQTAAEVPKVAENSVEILRNDLLKSTKVPLALPGSIPPVVQPYYTTVSEVKPERYDLSLDRVRDCYGVSACSFGQLIGELRPPQSIEEEYGVTDPNFKPVAQSSVPAQDVTLLNNIKGRFIPYVCGANCSHSKIVWEQGEYRYLVGLRGGSVPAERELSTLIELANAAIKGRR